MVHQHHPSSRFRCRHCRSIQRHHHHRPQGREQGATPVPPVVLAVPNMPIPPGHPRPPQICPPLPIQPWDALAGSAFVVILPQVSLPLAVPLVAAPTFR